MIKTVVQGSRLRLFLSLVIALFVTAIFGTLTNASADIHPPFELPKSAEVGKLRTAIIYTNKGKMYFDLFPVDAPWHVANFKYLADKGFYRGLTFHLYEAGYMVQGGDPKGTGFGGPGYSLPAEFSSRHHVFGTLGMARVPDVFLDGGAPANPARRSSGSQFQIILDDSPHLDGQYTIFGQLTDGASVLKELRQGDVIEDIKVFVRP